MSAKEVVELVGKAHKAGVQDVERMAKAGGRHGWKNAAGNLLRVILLNVSFPELYWADVPVWDPDANKKTTALLPFLLPFEVLEKLVSKDKNIVEAASTP